MLISDKNKLYAGGFRDGMREGMGIQFVVKLKDKDLLGIIIRGNGIKICPLVWERQWRIAMRKTRKENGKE